MNINRLSKFAITCLIVSVVFLFTGCDKEEKLEVRIENKKPNVVIEDTKQIENVIKEEKNNIEQIKNEPIKQEKLTFDEIFKDSTEIVPNEKQMILIFGTNTDPYSDKLKEDISNTYELQKKLKDDFSSYYFKAHENLKHKQSHNNKVIDLDTKTMIMVYGIESTPTIIFTDKNGKVVLIAPGYMPVKQFLVTMEFMKTDLWKDKNRKNGEIYDTLKKFYIKNGIDVISKKAN